MKRLFLYLIIFSAIAFGENGVIPPGELINKDSLITAVPDTAFVDSVNISALVQSQIEEAKTGALKSSVFMPVKEEPVKVKKPVEKKEAGFFAEIIITLNELNKKYTNIVIFIFGSVIILAAIFRKRIIKLTLGSKKKLRKAVSIMREEKPVTIQNKKLNEMRQKLSEANGIYNISDDNVSGIAKNLNVGKGELILAAKIKAFQLSKVLK